MNTLGKIFITTALGLFLAGCSSAKPGSANAAIRKAIEDHLANRPGLAKSQIVMELKQVQVHGDKADADVVFRSRNDPKAFMAFHYRLSNDGNHWKVEDGRPNASPHPPTGGTAGSGETSPPSSGNAPALPKNHPPL